MNAAVIDFLHDRRTPKAGWWLLAIGALALAVAVAVSQRWAEQRSAREVALQEAQVALQRARQVAQQLPPRSPDDRRLQGAAVRLRQPWLRVLRTVENTTESPVFLLSLVVDAASGRVQLEGEAASFADAVAYTQRLGENGALAPAHMVSHEAATDPTGRPAVRFVVATSWSR